MSNIVGVGLLEAVQRIIKSWWCFKVKLGQYRKAETYREVMRKDELPVARDAESVLLQVPISSDEVELELVQVGWYQLGFPTGSPRHELYSQALALGLQLCPAETALALWRRPSPLRFGDDKYSVIWIAMEPIIDAEGKKTTFRFRKNEYGYWELEVADYSPNHCLHGDVVFVKPCYK